MEPNDYGCDHSCHSEYDSTGNAPEKTVQNYEVVFYQNGTETTRIVEADSVESGDIVEFWIGDVLMFMVREDMLIRVTNLAFYLNIADKDDK